MMGKRSMHTLHAAAALLAFLFAWAPGAQAGAGGGEASHEIDMVKGHLFKPAVTHVRPGDAILFINRDKDLHSLSLPGREKLLDEEFIDPGHQFRFHVPKDAKPGTWPLACTIHLEMKARIIVDAK